jgi:uncharacterized protein (DUF2267 family)
MPVRSPAEAASRATLHTLAERVTRGEADDVATQLPMEFNPLLGRARGGSRAIRRDSLARRVAELASLDLPAPRMSLDEFLARVAKLAPLFSGIV